MRELPMQHLDISKGNSNARDHQPPTTVTVSGTGNDDVAIQLPPPPPSSSVEGITATGTPSNILSEGVEMANVPVEGTDSSGTYAAPIASFPAPLPEKIGEGFQGQGSLDPLYMSDVELETGWTSWLMGDDFDLDAVNSSLLQATTGEGSVINETSMYDPPAIDTPEDAHQVMVRKFAAGKEATRRKWHTYSERTPSDTMTPDPSLDHSQIDDSYRHQLAESLQQRVQTGVLPSSTFLVRFLSPLLPECSGSIEEQRLTIFLAYVASVYASVLYTFPTHLPRHPRAIVLPV
jgi:hypothetical protein